MKTRWTMRKGKRFVQAEFNAEGRAFLEDLRTLRPDLFKRARINSVIQAHEDFPTGIVAEINGDIIGPAWMIPLC